MTQRTMSLEGGTRPTGSPRGRSIGRSGRPGRLVGVLLVAVVIGLLAGRFVVAGRGSATSPSAPLPAQPGSTTEQRIASDQAALSANPNQPTLLTDLGVAYLNRARQIADPSYYTKAAAALARSRALDPSSALTMTATGLLELSRHNFATALAWGTRAHERDPAGANPLGVVFDAQYELGRYDAAAATAQAMVDRRPSLASLARVSAIREVRGDSAGAVQAMQQAAAAGGTSADIAFVQSLLGNLYLEIGRLGPAREAYSAALSAQPGIGYAEVGLALVDGAEGRLSAAVARLRPAVERLPLPGSVALLGDLESEAGDATGAAQQFSLVRAIEALNKANGVAVDLELARFEADHARDRGANPAAVVALAQAALTERPTIYAEDTMAWALRQAGRAAAALPHAERAVRLGTSDAVLAYHLAAILDDLGRHPEARAELAKAFSINPYVVSSLYLNLHDLPGARALARQLGVPWPGGSRE